MDNFVIRSTRDPIGNESRDVNIGESSGKRPRTDVNISFTNCYSKCGTRIFGYEHYQDKFA